MIVADDFGLDANICEGILQLGRIKKIDGVSVLVKKWNLHSRAFVELSQMPLQIGLHLDFLESEPYKWGSRDSFFLHGLFLFSFLRQRLRDEIHQQVRIFREVFGRDPDFIDGHLHVHAWPGVQLIFCNCYLELFQGTNRPWVRSLLIPDEYLKSAFGLNPISGLKNAFWWGVQRLNQSSLTQLPFLKQTIGIYSYGQMKNVAPSLAAAKSLVGDYVLVVHPSVGIGKGEFRRQEFDLLFLDEGLARLDRHPT